MKIKKNVKKGIALTLATMMIGAAFTSCTTTEKGFVTEKKINVITREAGSGTRDAFTELTGILEKDENGNKTDHTTNSAVTVNNTEAVLTNVAGDKYAIGYVSLGSLKDTVKALSINGVKCNSKNVKSGEYKISRPFNIATKEKNNPVTQDFINFILSKDGQNVIENEGYVSVREKESYTTQNLTGKVTVAGSSSVSPVMEKLKEAYEKINPEVSIEIQTSDSSAGMTAVKEGNCQIGMASRDLKDEEKDLQFIQIARDGIAVVVNLENPTEDISIDTVKNIFTGQLTNWSLS